MAERILGKCVMIDVGASQTRFVAANYAGGLMDSREACVIPNNMDILESEQPVDIVVQGDDEMDKLEFVINKEGDVSDRFPVHAILGSLAERHGVGNMRPSMAAPKHSQRVNHISILVATAMGVRRKLSKGGKSKVELFIAVPPIEVRAAREELNKTLVGSYTVYMPKLKDEVAFEITAVHCYEESMLAALSFFFSTEGKLMNRAKQYATGSILSLDIGASTTDLAIIKGGRYLDKSGQTYKVGGNIVREHIINRVRSQYGFELPIEDADKVVQTGRIQLGNKFEIVSDIISEAKRRFASVVTEHIQSYFRNIDIPLQSINAIVVSGGGSLPSMFVANDGTTHTTSKTMASYIIESLNNICGSVDIVGHSEEPRFANIKGLIIRSTYEFMSRDSVAGEEPTAKVEEPVKVETPAAETPADVAEQVAEVASTVGTETSSPVE